MGESFVHVEHLLGRPVVSPDGTTIGRLEEMRATRVGGDVVVTEFHVGSSALLERLSVLAIRLSPHGASRRSWRRGYRVRWDQLDLSNPRRPRLRCPVEELAVLDANDSDDDEVAVPADTPDAGDPIGGG